MKARESFHRCGSENEAFVGEVVTYDPVRRRGFLRVVNREWTGRVFFVLRELNGPLKAQVVEASRELNRAMKQNSDDAFHCAMKQVKQIIVGQRIPIEIRYSSATALPRAVGIG